MNSPASSWQHAALIWQHRLQTQWYKDCAADLRLVCPSVCFVLGTCSEGPFLCSSGYWIEEVTWHSVQAHGLPLEMFGRRIRPNPLRVKEDPVEMAVRRHVRETSRLLRGQLKSAQDSALLFQIQHRNLQTNTSKLALLAARLLRPGPPLHVALNWVLPVPHRAALVSLFAGDMFLGKHAANYFAKGLLPCSSRRRAEPQQRGHDSDRICMACWMRRGELEDEAHVCIQCPQYHHERPDFFRNLSHRLAIRSPNLSSDAEKLRSITSSAAPTD